MLEEAIEVIRLLWQGGVAHRRGRHYPLEQARVYDLPETPPPILVSGFGPKAWSWPRGSATGS
jgi:alkanesulfonate monooxygenase SsuD/methylene tetrahydromethanopterin reductase-like flavin-dependent oxidoreductase (luciferase family)